MVLDGVINMSRQIRTNLAYLRFSHGRLSQKAVSEATGIGQKTLSALETGASHGIEFNTILKLCEFFRVTPGDLLIIEDEPAEEPVSEYAREKAKELVARGLSNAMRSEKLTPDEVWKEFDIVRAKMQDSSGSKSNQEAAKENPSSDRA